MHEWHQFLQESSHAMIEQGKVISFGSPAIERKALSNDTVLCDLSHLGLLQLDGADAATFLQGQVTNDVKLLDGHVAHYTGYCNPKGRMLALFLAFAHYDHLHLQMPIELVESIAKRLKMYVMRSKVKITDVSSTIIKFGLSGIHAEMLLQPLFTTIPKQAYELVSIENGALLRLPSVTPRFEILSDMAHAPQIWNALKQHATPIGAEGWDWLEIQAGIPDVTIHTQEAFVPQMLNLDALNAINYKKGCYTGQEIVARTHYLGKVKRRMQLAHVSSEIKPTVGDDIVDNDQQAIGKIVRCANSVENGYDVLAECRLENTASDGIYWNNIKLTIKTLPYSLETQA